ncbi:ABC transporter permease [Microbacterium album]|uniref:ABC transporter permease n=1 Tax=Microbacterium album TaxID=2053191 RepID=A0A917IDX8_9MICO|nr:ABC transporter permease [Microbacterium album]GGH39613.1 ABC transporter permease [Microbacterium album]
MPASRTDAGAALRRAPGWLRWLAGRVGGALLVVWVVATVVFFALRASGDPLEAILGGPGSQASPEAVAHARAEYGLDQPLLVQYALQLWRIATLQLGDSYARRQPVVELIAAQLPATLLLATLALLLAWALALVGATIAAVSRGRAGRAAVAALRGLELVATVTPQFWLGAVLILVFASSLRILPATSSGADPAGLVLPVVTLAIPIAGFLAQVSRDALVDADRAPFATTARSRGAGEPRVLLHHTLRHASLPALSLSGWAFGNLLSGAVIVESLFARPGLGRLLLDGALGRDVPLVIGAVVVVAVLYVIVVTAVDAAELVVDPRLRAPRRSVAARGTPPRTPELAVGS